MESIDVTMGRRKLEQCVRVKRRSESEDIRAAVGVNKREISEKWANVDVAGIIEETFKGMADKGRMVS